MCDSPSMHFRVTRDVDDRSVTSWSWVWLCKTVGLHSHTTLAFHFTA